MASTNADRASFFQQDLPVVYEITPVKKKRSWPIERKKITTESFFFHSPQCLLFPRSPTDDKQLILLTFLPLSSATIS